MKIFFDTETTGLIRKYRGKLLHPKLFKAYDSSRMIEISYIITNNDEIVKQNTELVCYSENLNVENSHIHGITNEVLQSSGKPTNTVLEILHEDLQSYPVKALIAHNMEFDINILLAECYRYRKNTLAQELINLQKFDTMRMAKPLRIYSGFPKLVNLYCMLYKTTYEQKHRAQDDTELCKKCFDKYLQLFPDINLQDYLYHMPQYYEA